MGKRTYTEEQKAQSRTRSRDWYRRRHNAPPRRGFPGGPPLLTLEEVRAAKSEYGRLYYRRRKATDPLFLQKSRAKRKVWRDSNLDRERAKNREYLATLRAEVLVAYGDKCTQCGFNDRRALQLDHVHGGGTAERKAKHHVTAFYRKALRMLFTGEYQLLCANCNWIKRWERGEVRGP